MLPVNTNTGMARHARTAGLIVVALLVLGILADIV